MASGTDSGDEVFVEYRPNRRRWLGVVAVLGAVLLVLGILHAVRLTAFSPDAVVRAYFQALTDRDAAAARQVTAGESVAGEAELLTAAVLESEDYAPPADLEIVESSVDGRTAEAGVEFTISGRPQATTLRLRREDGLIDRVFHRWRIVDAVRPLPLGEVPGEVAVNGVPVLAQDLEGPRTLPALFGGYEVGVPADDPLWDPRTVTVLVGPDEPRQIDVPMAARPEVRAEVERQLTGILDRCAASTELLPPGCPFGNSRIAQATDVAWRIEDYPGFTLTPGPDGFGGVAMLLHSTSDGEAVVTGIQEAFSLERPFEVVVPFPVSGVVTVDGDAVTFEPAW